MKNIIYIVMFIGLFTIDYLLGNGFADMFQKQFCKISCFMKRTLRDDAKKFQIENPISLPVLITEILLFSLTLAIFNRFKRTRDVDRIDQLLQQSKKEINSANEFLEKWRLRKVPSDSWSYLDEEPQTIKPLKLEVPILHMAIIDTLGTARSQPERGDAGDTINWTESEIL